MVPNVIVPLLVFVVLFLVGTMAKALPSINSCNFP